MNWQVFRWSGKSCVIYHNPDTDHWVTYHILGTYMSTHCWTKIIVWTLYRCIFADFFMFSARVRWHVLYASNCLPKDLSNYWSNFVGGYIPTAVSDEFLSKYNINTHSAFFIETADGTRKYQETNAYNYYHLAMLVKNWDISTLYYKVLNASRKYTIIRPIFLNKSAILQPNKLYTQCNIKKIQKGTWGYLYMLKLHL